MLAKFGNGPYDGVALHVEKAIDHIILPISIRTELRMCERMVTGQCLYRLVTANDYEVQYTFEAIRI